MSNARFRRSAEGVTSPGISLWCREYRTSLGSRMVGRLNDLLAEVAHTCKGRTAQVLLSGFAWLGRRRVLWSKAYFAKSVGYVSEATVGRHIEHHWDVVA